MFPVHEYTVDRAKGIAKVGVTNPARTYVQGTKDEDGTLQVKYTTVQSKGGEIYYFDEGGVRMAQEDIPDYVLKDLQHNPIRRGTEKAEQVIKFCSYCPSPDNAVASNDYEAHLVKHLIAAGVQPTPSTKPEPKAKSKKAA